MQNLWSSRRGEGQEESEHRYEEWQQTANVVGNVVAAAISFMGLKDVHDEACWTYYWRETRMYCNVLTEVDSFSKVV